MAISLKQAQIDTFAETGFLVVEGMLDKADVEAARSRFEPLFAGEFETGLRPDEWNWRADASPADHTRQICNAWKSDLTLRRIVTREDIGQACAELRGWPGARINQDNVIWKPPGARALGFHQDDSYQDWILPNEMMTCWIALDDTRANQGTIEYVPGSHVWPLSDPIERFHAPEDPAVELRAAARNAGHEDFETLAIEVPAGSCVLHHGRTWHGSRNNHGPAPRRALVAHCMSSEARFHPRNVSPIYSRYKRQGSEEMDESFFPILWRQDGYRTSWL